MFKAFYWMFKDSDTKKMFIKNSIILYVVFLINMLIFCSIMYLAFTKSDVAILAILLLPLMFLLGLLMNGYFWEMTASIIERKTDIISTNIYGGKVKTTEMIEIPEIKFFKCVWRGFSGGVAYIIMEIPVIVILLNIIIFNKSEWVMILFVVQVIIWFLFQGLAWNYARNNSVFSMLNIYTAVHLLENRPGRYLWNLLLAVITWAILLIISGALEYILGFSANNEINNMQDVVKYTMLSIIIYIPYIYAQHVFAFLTGTIGNSNDY